MTYCKPKTLWKFGETSNADNGITTTVSNMYNDEVRETYSTTNDITHAVSSSNSDTQSIILEGHYFDSSNRKIFTVQEFTLTGQTPVTLSTPLCRATRYKVKKGTFSSPASNMVGNLSVYVGSGTTVTSGVISSAQDSRVKLYGTAANHSVKGATSISYYDYLVITGVGVKAKKATGSTAVIDYELEYKQSGGVFLPVGLRGRIRTASQSTDLLRGEPYIFIIPNDSDVELNVNSDTDNMAVAGFMDGFLLNDVSDPSSTLPDETRDKIIKSLRR